MKSPILASLVVGTVIAMLAGLQTGSESQPAHEKPVFDVKLTAQRASVLAGAKIEITARITNQLDREVYAVGSLDGSDVGWRWPILTLRVKDPAGMEVLASGVGRCGNMNPLRREDIVRLRPGEEFAPFDHQKGYFGQYRLETLSFTEPGKYEVVLVYDTRLSGPSKRERLHGDGQPDATLLALVERVPKGVFTSQKLTIEVRAGD